MDDFTFAHLMDLSERSQQKSIFTYSSFLTEEEQSYLLEQKRRFTAFDLFGGAEGSQRKMVRFGDEKAVNYTEPFPISCIHITPVNIRFAEKLSHRDYLGSIMALGIERCELGDILIRDYNAYVFCTEKISPYLIDSIHKIRNTNVNAVLCGSFPDEIITKTEQLRVTASSLRIDGILSAVTKLSRKNALALIVEKKVFINGSLCEKNDHMLSSGDTFSIRGIGKFIFIEVIGKSKKGKQIVQVKKYL